MRFHSAEEYYNYLFKASETELFEYNVPMCKYRGERFNCPVGLLIDEVNYDENFEGVISDELPEEVINIPPGMNKLELRIIQIAHDRTARKSREAGKWLHKDFITEINFVDSFQPFIKEVA